MTCFIYFLKANSCLENNQWRKESTRPSQWGNLEWFSGGCGGTQTSEEICYELDKTWNDNDRNLVRIQIFSKTSAVDFSSFSRARGELVAILCALIGCAMSVGGGGFCLKYATGIPVISFTFPSITYKFMQLSRAWDHDEYQTKLSVRFTYFEHMLDFSVLWPEYSCT